MNEAPEFLLNLPVAFRKTLAYALLAVTLIPFVAGLNTYHSFMSSVDSTIQDKQDLILKYDRIRAGSQTDQEKLDALKAQLSQGDYILREGELSVSVTLLEDYLRGRASDRNIVIDSLLPGKPIQKDGLWQLPVALEIKIGKGDIPPFLLELENSPPLIRIDRLEVQDLGETGKKISVKIDLHGFAIVTPLNMEAAAP